MEVPHNSEKLVIRKLISDALIEIADGIDKHSAKEALSFDKLVSSQDHTNTDLAGSQMSQRHMWFSTRGGFGDQIPSYAQTLLNMAVTELGLEKPPYNEFFRSSMADDNYNIGSYLSRVRKKTSELRRVAFQLLP